MESGDIISLGAERKRRTEPLPTTPAIGRKPRRPSRVEEFISRKGAWRTRYALYASSYHAVNSNVKQSALANKRMTIWFCPSRLQRLLTVFF